ncbi:MAG: OmpH family outer membrane protein [Desulfovibrio sp.]
MQINKILCLAIAMAILVPSFAHARVGFIDPQRIITESKVGKVAQTDIMRIGRQKDERIQAVVRQIKQLQSQIDQKNMSGAQKNVAESRLNLLLQEHDLLIEKSNFILQKEESDLYRFIVRKADKILRAIAQEHGYDLIITDPGVVGYVSHGVDITDEVIRALDAQ